MALYPALLTAVIRSCSEIFNGAITWADSIARLTTALTPGTLFRALSMVLTHEEQVIPVRCKSTWRFLPSFCAIAELIVVRLLFFLFNR